MISYMCRNYVAYRIQRAKISELKVNGTERDNDTFQDDSLLHFNKQ